MISAEANLFERVYRTELITIVVGTIRLRSPSDGLANRVTKLAFRTFSYGSDGIMAAFNYLRNNGDITVRLCYVRAITFYAYQPLAR